MGGVGLLYNLSKAIPVTDYIMPRERLFTLLQSYEQKRVVFLTAGNGYGKTALLTSFFQKHPCLASWITLTQPICSFDELRALLPPLSTGKEGWIVIDQSENVQLDASNLDDLILWIEQLPPAATIVFSGRTQPIGLPISRWKMQRIAIAIDKAELAFTKEEAAELFHSHYQFTITNYADKRLLEDMEGWPAGLALFHEAMAKKTSGTFSSRTDLYQYVANEIIADLPDDVRTFLLHASLFRDLDEIVLSSYQPNWPVQEYIQAIGHTHLMFSPNQTNVYRLNELFRKFFYQMAEQEWGKNEIKKRHHQLAKLYRDHYRFLEALSQAVAAGEDELVIAIIMEMTERYEPSSFLQVLDGYLEQVSPSVHLAEISLFLFRCIPTSLLGQLIEPLRSIIDRCEVENSPAYGELCHRLATIYFFQGELQQALEFSTISLTFSMKQQDERMIALNLSKLAKIHRFFGNHEQSVSYTRQALAKADLFGFQHTQMHTLWNAAELSMDEGDLEKARRFAEQAIQLSTQCDKASIVYPMCTMSRYYRKQSNLQEALHWANLAIDHANRYSIQSDQGWSRSAAARCYAELGEIEKAQDLMKQAVHLFLENRHFHAYYLRKLKAISSSSRLPNRDEKTGKLKIRLFGPFSIEIDGKPIRFRRQTSLRILLLLVSNYERRWSKEELIGLLSPDEPEEAASNQFYVALSILRKQLEPGLKKGRDSKFIVYQDSLYSFQLEEAEVDMKTLKELMAKPYSKETAAKAIELYQNGLLPEYPYEDWLSDNRTIVQEQFMKTLQAWSAQCEEVGKFEEAANMIKTILTLEPYDERFHLQYVQLLIKSKQPGKSRKAANQAIELFENELGITVRPQFELLFSDDKLQYSS